MFFSFFATAIPLVLSQLMFSAAFTYFLIQLWQPKGHPIDFVRLAVSGVGFGLSLFVDWFIVKWVSLKIYQVRSENALKESGRNAEKTITMTIPSHGTENCGAGSTGEYELAALRQDLSLERLFTYFCSMTTAVSVRAVTHYLMVERDRDKLVYAFAGVCVLVLVYAPVRRKVRSSFAQSHKEEWLCPACRLKVDGTAKAALVGVGEGST